jgi:hypothetical protein
MTSRSRTSAGAGPGPGGRSVYGGAAAATTLTINRAPVLTLWAAVVAERLGYDRDEAVTLGRAVAGLNAAAKARSLGITKPREKPAVERKPAPAKPGALVEVSLCNRIVPCVQTADGLRATSEGKPTAPASVHRYLESKFGDALAAVRQAMTALAKSLTKDELAGRAFALYEAFRPGIPSGVRGWGAKGVLDLAQIRALAGKWRGGRVG